MTTPAAEAIPSRRLAPRGNPASIEQDRSAASRQPPAAATAFRLAARLGANSSVLLIVSSERRAEETARALRSFAPEAQVLLLSPWDCLPYDRSSPSHESMGQRMSALRQCLGERAGARVLVTSADAALQRVPPSEAVSGCVLELRRGETLDRQAFEAFAGRAGYEVDDRVDEPGEIALRGGAIEIFPADGEAPFRLMLDEADRIESIFAYDPRSQRTEEEQDKLLLGAASELIGDDVERLAGAEHRLPQQYERLRTVFDYLPDATLWVSEIAAERAPTLIEQIREAHQAATDFGAESRPLPPEALYLSAEEWTTALASRQLQELDLEGLEPAPRFTLERNPSRAFAGFTREQLEGGQRVVVTGTDGELERLRTMLRRSRGPSPKLLATWHDVDAEPTDQPLALPFDLDAGFVDRANNLVLIAAPDALGTRLADAEQTDAAVLLGQTELRVGDVVVHEDYGVGILRDLDRVEVEGSEQDTVRLEYHGGASVLVPVEDFGRLWRYGADAEAVTLDRLHTDAWKYRRAEVSAQIDAAAEGLAAAAKARAQATAEPIQPPAAAFARLAARFPYPETPDQSAAIHAVLEDLASGRPMNRLVCGDVGFGKTEVALRAAAAAALAGRQVVLVAPTTVLVRQHLQSFERRFAGTDIKVAQLSRLLTPAQSKAVREELASGEVQVLVATEAVVGKDVAFNDLVLVIIDEEQRFGAKLKAQLRALAPDLHVLMMSATPIPRTLQAALVGLQDVSIIATPPARRRPVRTFLAPFDAGSLRTALLRERRRGGQSFIVVPRIEDIPPFAEELVRIVPEFTVAIAHGDLPPAEIDRVLVDFANGVGDILLATTIIESGLDVPRANTMLVWHADRFGLSQLHQLRGRVGRARAQGIAYLLTDPNDEIPEATRARLSTLEAFDRLGSGFEISARDLDLRGGGDLLGDEQAGHMKLLGAGLYQDLLERAVTAAKGEGGKQSGPIHLNLGGGGSIPPDYVPEAVVRINLYARLQRLRTTEALDAFADELADRFGELPEATRTLLGAARIAIAAPALGISKIEAGPLAIALTAPERSAQRLAKKSGGVLELSDGRLISRQETQTPAERVRIIGELLESLAA
ncbi:DEAD/DEAH box helicase [Devosia sp. 1635]|uniref:DEAD/DEAH box helicase n=1 Tax=Devosia sp. 1635 TaxID=2726066 RepID=UPI001565B991|nr:DEAD/DEAH box helicase [Devosia sp. 1635]